SSEREERSAEPQSSAEQSAQKPQTRQATGRGRTGSSFPRTLILIESRKKKNRIGPALKTCGADLRCGSPWVGLGSGVGLSGLPIMRFDSWSGPRPYYSSPETPYNYRYLNPRRDFLKPWISTSGKKTPLQQPTRGRGELKLLQTSAPASTLS